MIEKNGWDAGEEDTIAAVATATGEGGIGIIRLSGPQAFSLVKLIFQLPNKRSLTVWRNKQVIYGQIIEPKSKAVIDEVLLVLMQGPASYTREDVAEIQCHGGPVPLRRILQLLLSMGARLATAGEFTKRAFLNGRLDLTQAEAVIDVIRAKTDASLQQALSNLKGNLSVKIKELRQLILQMIAQLEAAIDFPEDDIEELAAAQAAEVIAKLRYDLQGLLANAQTGKILRDGLSTVIIGKPNVGKSSLLNALLQENRAIVTNVPGTTRDVIEEYVNIKGIPLKIVDTAGIRETTDFVEKIGVEKAQEFMRKADLVLLLLDASAPLTKEDEVVLTLLAGQQAFILLNKSDLPTQITEEIIERKWPGWPVLKISVKDGFGLQALEEQIENLVYAGKLRPGEAAFVYNARHIGLLAEAEKSLVMAQDSIDAGMPPDCLVVDLRAAWEQLGEINGETVGEDIIDRIFAEFCIGK